MTNLDQSLIGLSTFLDQRVANRQKELEYYRNKFDEEKRKRLVVQSFLNTPIGKEMNSQGIINESTPFEAINLALNAFGLDKDEKRYQENLTNQKNRNAIEDARYAEEQAFKELQFASQEEQKLFNQKMQQEALKINQANLELHRNQQKLQERIFGLNLQKQIGDLYNDADKSEVNKWTYIPNGEDINPEVKKVKDALGIDKSFWGDQKYINDIEDKLKMDISDIKSVDDLIKIKNYFKKNGDTKDPKVKSLLGQLEELDLYTQALSNKAIAINRFNINPLKKEEKLKAY